MLRINPFGVNSVLCNCILQTFIYAIFIASKVKQLKTSKILKYLHLSFNK